MKRVAAGSGETKLEDVISYVLIIGVVTSLLFEDCRYYFSSIAHTAVSRFLTRARCFSRERISSYFSCSLFSGSPVSWPIRVITLGIAVLILTPYVRAILSVIYFAAHENWKYLVITLFVLTILTISLLDALKCHASEIQPWTSL